MESFRALIRTPWRAAAGALLAALMLTTIYRAATQAISHDEGVMFEWFQSGPWSQLFGSEFGNLRRDASKNLDLSASKDFPFGERRYVQLRIETFNITNHVTFAAPNLSPTSSAFGTIASQANSPRYIQLGARVVW